MNNLKMILQSKLQTGTIGRQGLMNLFIVLSVVFMVFYWTGLLFNKKISELAGDRQLVTEKIEEVQGFMDRIDSGTKDLKLTNGLLGYLQGMSAAMDSKIINIKLVSSINKTEQVAFKADNLYYDELVRIIQNLEQYSNVRIKNVTIQKRFDNPKKVDANFDVVKEL